ncbi:DUF1853 family protein [Aquimarina litoralis]|uniref:DUF1853 family protein n=1 Tax=Aquimarina litoralis TaxID=584605 RepID=UPI001C593C45|nr:DUF1853 family protein [Aquimarina litoralis]MBW1295893.1 DUF1853 family protein [Aquimarina litoralis]
MAIHDQYLGFLDSKLLWKNDTLFELPQFDLKKTEYNPSLPINVAIHDNEVLGKRIEYFYEYYINSCTDYSVVVKNLQIFKDKITIGELDFIVENIKQNQLLHIELIYKFYIYIPKKGDNELERWIGPNKKDNLLEKVAKLKNKQLPLLYRPETIEKLKELGISAENISQKVSFFAQLFVPLSYQNNIIPKINNDCISGFWIHKSEFILDEYDQYQYFIPQKKDWITAPRHHRIWHSYQEILEQLEIHLIKKKSPLVWIKHNEDSFTKCFIVCW